jgi:hypothetical protein
MARAQDALERPTYSAANGTLSCLPTLRSDAFPFFLGAVRARGETLFRVWAPQARAVEVVFEDSQEAPLALKRDSRATSLAQLRARLSL